MTELDNLLREVRNCTVCAQHLPLGPKPVLRASATAKILLIGQAPGTRVHASGVPWDDASGVRLREWMGIDEATFYDENKIAIVPMGFCYPGKGKSGDLPPRKECAPAWHKPLLQQLPKASLTILIGQYAQAYYLGTKRKATLTDTVRAFEEYMPTYIPTVHPSPRNVFWLQKNRWFQDDLLPILRDRVHSLL